jgi:xanthine dehydrogenase accessory factor
MENNLDNFTLRFQEISNQNTDFVTVTLTNVKGSAPQDLGARMIFNENGILYGTVGGGKIEAHCMEVCKQLLTQKNTEKVVSHTWNLQRDIGMTCGGEVSLLFEIHRTDHNWNVVIFGAGHVSQALTRVLLNLDCHITVIDNRREWLDKLPKSSNLKTIFNAEMKNEVAKLPANSYVALMTMGHAKDVPVLFEALQSRDFPYLGVIGSLQKRNRMESELIKMGIEKESLSKMICPIGEDLGSNSPSEIAISIAAQLLKLRDFN